MVRHFLRRLHEVGSQPDEQRRTSRTAFCAQPHWLWAEGLELRVGHGRFGPPFDVARDRGLPNYLLNRDWCEFGIGSALQLLDGRSAVDHHGLGRCARLAGAFVNHALCD